MYSGWMHRHCSGLSVPHFAQMSSSNEGFLCVYCTLIKQASEIYELKEKVQSLKLGMPKFFVEISDHQSTKPLPASHTTTEHKSSIVNSFQHSATQFQNDCKFNLVIHGFAELPCGISHYECTIKDTNNILEKIIPSFSGSTLRKCYQL